jgi:hypothetical protein
MRVAVVYVFPMVNQRVYFPLAQRFCDTWRKHPGHSLHVLCNGGNPGPMDQRPFAGLTQSFHTCSNVGWDIGAFQWACESIPCDLLVCLGAPVHFYRSGWLDKMVDAYLEYGPGLYGCAAYLSPNWHVRTTSFAMPPELLSSYPYEIGSTRASRYFFEHGSGSFTRHVLELGFPCVMVTWKGCFPFDQWRDHAPNRDEILVRDQHIH